MPDSCQVIVAGHACLDVIPALPAGAARLADLIVPGRLVEVGPAAVAAGGAVSNTGLALHRLGVAVRLVARIGDDLWGRALLDIYRRYGTHLADGMSVAQGQPTSYSVVLSAPGIDRVFLHSPAANDTFAAADVSDDTLDSGARILHFGYPTAMARMREGDGAETAALFRRARERGMVTSLDVTLPDAASPSGRTDWSAFLRRVLPEADLFLPGFDEALFMVDRKRFDQLEQRRDAGGLSCAADGALLAKVAGRLLEFGAAVVVLKLGAEGLYLRTTSDAGRLEPVRPGGRSVGREWLGRELFLPAFVVEVAGTTGAGDCAVAGFLASLLEGRSPEESLAVAAAAGAASVEQADATSGIPAREDLVARVEAGWPRRTPAIKLPGWTWDGARRLAAGPNDRGAKD